jgi:chromosome segregation protein
MTAIVGPNGCGKSNVSDAIKWVLGEQSPKAMRGSQMVDCIFTGTDTRKPMGMAEVSLTFAECEGILDTEYNEVTIMRRVLRDGQGEYFINKTPCRLKDIQRMFMGTGVGTSSYSFMEQGKIDRVLSSRPEDRRAVFEEASGITKFKADKREALRKLEQTEGNLLRLTDVIAEVKRQIGSLQRQAGKARRYKALREELRILDLYVSRQRLSASDENISAVQARIGVLDGDLASMQSEIEELDAGAHTVREAVMATEREIGTTVEAATQANSRLEHTRSLIASNHQRMEENRQWSERDRVEAEDLKRQIEEQERRASELAREIERVTAEHAAASHALDQVTGTLSAHQGEMDQTRSRLHALRQESLSLDGTLTQLQNQLTDLDGRERALVLQRERLATEKAQLTRQFSSHEGHLFDIMNQLGGLKGDASRLAQDLRETEARQSVLREAIQSSQKELAGRQSGAAALEARLDVLRRQEEAREGYASGARMLLDPANPLQIEAGSVIGALAAHITVETRYQIAVEAVLRSWLDAVVVEDCPAAFALLERMETASAGPARLLAASTGEVAGESDGAPNQSSPIPVSADENLVPLLARLFANVRIVEAIADIPRPVPPGDIYVTLTGTVVRGDGSFERWTREAGAANPLARHHAMAEESARLEEERTTIAATQEKLQGLLDELRAAEDAISSARARSDEARRALALKEGESQIVERETRDAKHRLETVTWEHEQRCKESEGGIEQRREILRMTDEGRARRDAAARQVHELTETMARLETRLGSIQQDLADCRVVHANLTQRKEHLLQQAEAVSSQLRSLTSAHKGRLAGIASYTTSIEKLAAETAAAEAQIAALEEASRRHAAHADALRKNRDRQTAELTALECELGRKRAAFDGARSEKSRLDVQIAENRMRRQNLLDRVCGEYGVDAGTIAEAPPPPPPENEPMPSLEGMESTIVELRAKIDGMGPVNLVAIEEYRELEERHTFLTAQEADLQKAKAQLMDMIREINKTTTEMFNETFAQINANFEVMFQKLFNGGTAKLVLVNEEDVLECGIEIIARPPGKRLQNVSLLSGGERTMTAVALLFSIYLIKPSPFCMLDELDAALDDSNIGRFVTVLRDFLSQSQFVVITHNRQTIAAADTIYGVTMPERGVSRIVSMKFTENRARQQPELIRA